MAPKAYDDPANDAVDGEVVPRYGRDLIDPDPHSYEAVLSPIRTIGLGEILTVLTLLYVCTIAAFNAAYFSNVPGNFVEFFSLTDLIQTNLPMIQYFFSVFILYGVFLTFLALISAVAEVDLKEKARELIEPVIVKYHLESHYFWLAFLLALAAFYLLLALLGWLAVTNFTLSILPTLLFQGALLYFFWVGYKYALIPARSLASAAFIGLFMCSHNAGHAWFKSQVADASHIQALQDKEGNCFDRNILRNSSSGLLLYNQSLGQFEFRTKDTIKTVFQNRGCV